MGIWLWRLKTSIRGITSWSIQSTCSPSPRWGRSSWPRVRCLLQRCLRSISKCLCEIKISLKSWNSLRHFRSFKMTCSDTSSSTSSWTSGQPVTRSSRPSWPIPPSSKRWKSTPMSTSSSRTHFRQTNCSALRNSRWASSTALIDLTE